MDNRTVALVVQGPNDEDNLHGSLVGAVKDLLRCEWTVVVKHIYPEVNYVADCLASLGSSLPCGLQVWDSPLSQVLVWLTYDTIGIAHGPAHSCPSLFYSACTLGSWLCTKKKKKILLCLI